MQRRLSAPLQEVTRQPLEVVARNPVDVEIPAEMCKLVVYTDGGAARRPGEGAVASWGVVAVFMCGNEAVDNDLTCSASRLVVLVGVQVEREPL